MTEELDDEEYGEEVPQEEEWTEEREWHTKSAAKEYILTKPEICNSKSSTKSAELLFGIHDILNEFIAYLPIYTLSNLLQSFANLKCSALRAYIDKIKQMQEASRWYESNAFSCDLTRFLGGIAKVNNVKMEKMDVFQYVVQQSFDQVGTADDIRDRNEKYEINQTYSHRYVDPDDDYPTSQSIATTFHKVHVCSIDQMFELFKLATDRMHDDEPLCPPLTSYS